MHKFYSVAMGTVLLATVCLSCSSANHDGAGGSRGSDDGGAGGGTQADGGAGDAGNGGGSVDPSCLVATETPITLERTIVGGGQILCGSEANLSITSCLDYRDTGKEEWVEGVCQTKTLAAVKGIPLEVSLNCSVTKHDYKSRVSATANGIIVSEKVESAISTHVQCP